MVRVKEALAEADAERLFAWHLPEVKAGGDDVRAAEEALGEPLDPQYREFLEHADGWRGFHRDIDLFGSRDLRGSSRFRYATEVLGYVEQSVLDAGSLRREDLLPIAVSQDDRDLVVMTRRSSPSPGTVVWLAGEEIDRFPDFVEFFLAMIDYNRHLRRLLLGEA